MPHFPLLGALERGGAGQRARADGAGVSDGSVVNAALVVGVPLRRGALVVAARDARLVTVELRV